MTDRYSYIMLTKTGTALLGSRTPQDPPCRIHQALRGCSAPIASTAALRHLSCLLPSFRTESAGTWRGLARCPAERNWPVSCHVAVCIRGLRLWGRVQAWHGTLLRRLPLITCQCQCTVCGARVQSCAWKIKKLHSRTAPKLHIHTCVRKYICSSGGMVMVPLTRGQSFLMTRNRDDLPQPFGPVTKTREPRLTCQRYVCMCVRVFFWSVWGVCLW